MLAVVVVAQAGAAGPSRTSWASTANKACAVSYAKTEALPRPTTSDLLISDLRATLRISKQLTQQLSRIPSPSSERRSIGNLLTLANSGNSVVEKKLVPALLSGDQVAVTRFAAQSEQIGDRFNNVARMLGARICAENPTPQG